MNLVSDNITIMSEARDDPDVPQGNTVNTRAAEKIQCFETMYENEICAFLVFLVSGFKRQNGQMQVKNKSRILIT